MTSLIDDALAAAMSAKPFGEAFRKARCIRRGHDARNSDRIDKLRSDRHPSNSKDMAYTVNIMRCNTCGGIYHDAGLEFRKPL